MIVQINPKTNKVNKFNTIAEAVRETGIHHSNISVCLSGQRNTAGGFLWRYMGATNRIKRTKKEDKIELFCQSCSAGVVSKDRFMVCLDCLNRAKK